MSARLVFPDVLPVLILAHDGVAPGHLTSLDAAVPGLTLQTGADAALLALAQGWTTLAEFGPLKGHRQRGTTPSPDQPWYGADRTDPDLYLRRMGPVVVPGIADVPAGTKTIGFVSRQLFWTPEEAQNFCAFFLGAMPHSVIVLPVGDTDMLQDEFRRQSGWREEAAGKAVAAIAENAQTIAEVFSGRTVTWELEKTETVPDNVRAALSAERPVRGRS